MVNTQQRARLALLVTPRSVLRRHPHLVARKWTYPHRRPGRPPKPEALRQLVLHRGRTRGVYRRIHGELLGLGRKLGASAVWEIVQKAGIDTRRAHIAGVTRHPTGPWITQDHADARQPTAS
ncbi:hypothetical protein [Streptomyces sp. GMR22]|uniref:hypothetical protein n=1 Tax=Streptomyces sp. GMR22 TaxID=2759524 RepID=UPI001F21A86D|nr:hypothetical protein [Streptomyces sp. GMR22]